jgi:hypothetical protein
LKKSNNGRKLLFKAINGLSEADAKSIKVTSKWNVKDVIAHIIGWELASTKGAKQILREKEKPGFFHYNFDAFNRREVVRRKDKTLKQLIAELKIAGKEFEKFIKKIPNEEFEKYPELWEWLKEAGHDKHHALQIIKAVEKCRG